MSTLGPYGGCGKGQGALNEGTVVGNLKTRWAILCPGGLVEATVIGVGG